MRPCSDPADDARLVAVIPAAGFSRRMGRPKLLLPLGKRSVIEHVVETLNEAGVSEIYVLAREEDAALRDTVARTAACVVTTPQPTRDMRSSVELLLGVVRRERQPGPQDGWLLCPADHPAIDAVVVRELVEEWRREPSGIVVPVHAGRRGHPVIFSWDSAERLDHAPADRGVDWLLETHAGDVREVPAASANVLWDLDTPEDYSALCAAHAAGRIGVCGPHAR